LYYYQETKYSYSAYFSGKRRALIPPYVGYTNESLQPIPEEVNLSILDTLVPELFC
jgi:hypothetical protein